MGSAARQQGTRGREPRPPAVLGSARYWMPSHLVVRDLTDQTEMTAGSHVDRHTGAMSTEQSALAIPFTVIAFEGDKKTQLGAGGFLCVLEDQITFVGSRYVRYAMSLPLVGMFLPDRIRPTGPDDPRTLSRFPFSGLHSFSDGRDAGFKGGAMRGQKVYILGEDGHGRFYSGGQINPALTFDNLAPIVRTALTARGFAVSDSPGILTVQREN